MKKATILLGLLVYGAANAEDALKKSFEVYGFLQTDYIQDFKRVDPKWDETLRPSKIPTTEGQFGQDGQALVSVKQSRFGVQGHLPVDGQDLYTKFEFDMFGVGPDEGKTTIRLRHAYGKWGKWLAGQTHSLFMDIDQFPNVIDYWGPAGMVFLRNPQIRFTPVEGKNTFAIAIEKPSNDIDPGQIRTVAPEFGNNLQPNEKYPDLSAQYRLTGDWGHFQASGILRRIGYETLKTKNNNPNDEEWGYGLALTSNLKMVEKDILHLSILAGRGIASYMNDGGTDLAPQGSIGNLRAEAVPLMGLSAYYDHYWSDKYSTSLGYSRTQVDNTSFQQDTAFKKGEYASVNFLTYPGKNMLVGAELLWGAREDKNGNYGDDVRTQISFKYNFSSLDF